MNATTWWAWTVVIQLALLIIGWLTYANRRQRLEKHPGEGKLFRCEQCQLVYADRRLYPVLECPRCHHPNTALRR
jgi:Zn finger protein HypA/HybF involved in hydrogenase expression